MNRDLKSKSESHAASARMGISCPLLFSLAALAALVPLESIAGDRENPAYRCRVQGLDVLSSHYVSMWQFWGRGGQDKYAAEQWEELAKAMNGNPDLARMALPNLPPDHAIFHPHMTKDCALLKGLGQNDKFNAVGHAQALISESLACPICNPPERKDEDQHNTGDGTTRGGQNKEVMNSVPGRMNPPPRATRPEGEPSALPLPQGDPAASSNTHSPLSSSQESLPSAPPPDAEVSEAQKRAEKFSDLISASADGEHSSNLNFDEQMAFLDVPNIANANSSVSAAPTGMSGEQGGMLERLGRLANSSSSSRSSSAEENPTTLVDRRRADDILFTAMQKSASSQVVKEAVAHRGSTEYSYDTAKGNLPAKTNKCNLFVYDVLCSAAACPPLRDHNWIPPKYAPIASDYAEPTKVIPGLPVVQGDPRPGDIVAEAHNYSDASGHVGIVVDYDAATNKGTSLSVSAKSGRVELTDWGFRKGQTPTFRRPAISPPSRTTP